MSMEKIMLCLGSALIIVSVICTAHYAGTLGVLSSIPLMVGTWLLTLVLANY